MREKRIRMFSLPLGARILELGCGDGLNLKILQRLGYKNVFGLDNSFVLLKRVKDVPVVLADACKTGFARNSFDVIFIDSFFHHLEDPGICLQEIKRILKPQGLLCFMEPRKSLARSILDWLTFLPFLQAFLFFKNRSISLREEYGVYYKWLRTYNDFMILLKNSGFKVLFLKNGLIGFLVKSLNV